MIQSIPVSSPQLIPLSAICSRLYVRSPLVDEIQPIYVKETASRGRVQKITIASLRSFLENTPLTKSGECYELKKAVHFPGRDIVLFRFKLPRDPDLELGILDTDFKPMRNSSGTETFSIFLSQGNRMSFESIQLRLSRLSTNSSIDDLSTPELTACPSFSSTITVLNTTTAALSNSIPFLGSSQETNLEDQNIVVKAESSASISSEPIELKTVNVCRAIFIKHRDLEYKQTIYIGETIEGGPTHELAITSLKSFLQEIEVLLGAPGKVYECEKLVDNRSIHFQISLEETLSIALLNNQSQPIRDRWRRIALVQIITTSGKMLKMDTIQNSLDYMPTQQKQKQKLKSASDPCIKTLSLTPKTSTRACKTASGVVWSMGQFNEFGCSSPSNDMDPIIKK